MAASPSGSTAAAPLSRAVTRVRPSLPPASEMDSGAGLGAAVQGVVDQDFQALLDARDRNPGLAAQPVRPADQMAQPAGMRGVAGMILFPAFQGRQVGEGKLGLGGGEGLLARPVRPQRVVALALVSEDGFADFRLHAAGDDFLFAAT
jgi:hypothetical protein